MTISNKALYQEIWDLLQNEGVADKLRECKSPEDCYDVVRVFIPGISMSEFVESMKSIHAYLDETHDGLLSDDELDAVAGGTSKFGAPVALGVGIVAAAAAAV